MAHKKRLTEPEERLDETADAEMQDENPEVEQSGDLQGLSDVAEADGESVRELVEEGQFFEADVVSGVENAPPADDGPIKIRRRSEDDVPPEYRERPRDEPQEE